jgi:hypothetical protein
MIKHSKKLILLFVLLQAISTIVYAQAGSSELLTNLLTAIFGKLPEPCLSEFGSQACLECMGIGKLLPLMLLIAIFFFAFYFILKYAGMEKSGQVSQTGEAMYKPGKPAGTELRIAAVIGVVIGLLLLHTEQVQNALDQVLFWANIFVIFLIIVFIGSVGRFGRGGWIWIIFAIIIIAFVYPLIWGRFGAIAEYFRNTCVG